MRSAASIALVSLMLALHASAAAFGPDQSLSPVIRVGVVEIPPLYMKSEDNRWSGFSVELWAAVARGMGAAYELREFSGLEPMLAALEGREIDVIPSLIVRERYEPRLDFSQSYAKSGMAIAVPAEKTGYRWIHVFEGLVSDQVLRAVGFMLLMSVAAGLLVWMFERRRNREMFGGEGMLEGIGHGIWWAMVTMTTVGYGDKAPRTIGGRLVALVWMIVSIIFIASFTANITTALTLNDLHGKVRGFDDLKRARVGAVAGSESADYLMTRGATAIPFETLQGAMAALAERKIDAFVQDEHVLRFMAKRDFPGRVQVLPATYDEYFVSIALQERSPLRKPINKALLRFMKSNEWDGLLNRYFG